jgi:hypothetical protein
MITLPAPNLLKLAKELKSDYAKLQTGVSSIERGRTQFRAAILAMAPRLVEAKRELNGSTKFFHEWLDKHKIKLSKDDRSAMIAIGENFEAAKTLITTTERTSIRRIWELDVRPSIPRPVTSQAANSPTLTTEIVATSDTAIEAIASPVLIEPQIAESQMREELRTWATRWRHLVPNFVNP